MDIQSWTLDDVREILPPSQNLLKSIFPDKIFDKSVFLISSRAQTGAVHTNSTRRTFLNRSQGFLTSFLGVKADWKSYFENYKKKGARISAPIRLPIGEFCVKLDEESFGKGPGPQKRRILFWKFNKKENWEEFWKSEKS